MASYAFWVNGASPWVADASESVGYLVETPLGQYSSGLVSEWSLPDGFDADEVSTRMPDAPKVWSDGMLDSVAMLIAFKVLILVGVFCLCPWSIADCSEG